jgi:hypothetical protein
MKPKHIIYQAERGENAHRDSTIYYVDENQKISGILKKNVDVYCKRKKINLGAYRAGIRSVDGELSKWSPTLCLLRPSLPTEVVIPPIGLVLFVRAMCKRSVVGRLVA